MTPDFEPPRLRGNFVLLKADRLQLLLPQHGVGAARYLAAAPRPTARPGWFEFDDEQTGAPRRVAALSQRLEPLAEFPAGRFLLTPFTPAGGAGVGAADDVLLGWTAVQVLIDADLRVQRIPAPMLAPDAALTEFVELDDNLAFCCSGERLFRHAFDARH